MLRLSNVRPSGRFVVIVVITIVAVAIFSMGGETDLADDKNQVSDKTEATVREQQPTPENFEVANWVRDKPQEQISQDAELALDKMIRIKYENSPDLPDGLAFASTLMLLESMQDDRIVSRDWIIQEMDFGYTEAEQFRDRLLVIGEQLRDETTRLIEETLCSHGVPKVYGDDVFVALEKVEDMRDAVAEDLYLKLASELPQSHKQQLQGWIDANKLTTVSISHNQKERFKQHDVSGDAYAAQLCIPPT